MCSPLAWTHHSRLLFQQIRFGPVLRETCVGDAAGWDTAWGTGLLAEIGVPSAAGVVTGEQIAQGVINAPQAFFQTPLSGSSTGEEPNTVLQILKLPLKASFQWEAGTLMSGSDGSRDPLRTRH